MINILGFTILAGGLVIVVPTLALLIFLLIRSIKRMMKPISDLKVEEVIIDCLYIGFVIGLIFPFILRLTGLE